MEPLTASLPGIAEQFNFSDCGGHLVLKYRGLEHPKIQSLSKSKLIKAAIRQQGQLGDGRSRKVLHPSAQLGAVTLKTSATRNAGHIVAVQKESGEMAFQQISMSRSGLKEVQLVQHSSGTEELQPLLSLPDSTSKSVRPSVHAPGPQEETFTVILNHTAQPLYDFSENIGAGPPMVIEKDQRALVQARKRKILEISSEDPGPGNESAPGRIDLDE